MSQRHKKVFVAGSTGMVGSAVVRQLRAAGYDDLIVTSSAELDLTDQSAVNGFFRSNRPQIVILAAAKVGGIAANDAFRADFIYRNLMIEANTVQAAYLTGADKLIFLGSSCIYPRDAEQPLREEALLTGPLESTNEPYAIAKIAGLKLCESYYRQYASNFFSVMPCNLYGPNDNYDPQASHVIPALIRRFHDAARSDAATVTVWGTGTPLREFLFVDDLAEAVVALTGDYDASDIYDHGISHVNVGSGLEISIAKLAAAVAEVVGYRGAIKFDPTRPDGTPRKVLDSGRMRSLGWKPRTDLKAGLKMAYADFLERASVPAAAR